MKINQYFETLKGEKEKEIETAFADNKEEKKNKNYWGGLKETEKSRVLGGQRNESGLDLERSIEEGGEKMVS